MPIIAPVFSHLNDDIEELVPDDSEILATEAAVPKAIGRQANGGLRHLHDSFPPASFGYVQLVETERPDPLVDHQGSRLLNLSNQPRTADWETGDPNPKGFPAARSNSNPKTVPEGLREGCSLGEDALFDLCLRNEGR